ncbi:MAG: T9SS type A sorting domain-containing protein [Bacteroidota bacterium]
MIKKILLFVLLACSVIVAAHSKPSASGMQRPSNNTVNNPRHTIKDSSLHTMIQVNDSVYKWQWDPLSHGWAISSKIIEMVYDPGKNLTSDITQKWNGLIWENLAKYTATYDASNNLTSELNQSWNGAGWDYTWKYTHTYDANNNWTSDLGQSWNGNGWENSWQCIYTYDASNNMTSNLSQNWGAGGWENSSLYTYLYDAANNQIYGLGQNWNVTTWDNYIQFTYTYDVNNNQTGYYNELWNGNSWDNFSLCAYTYDSNNNRTTGTVQYWDGFEWINTWHFNDYYDASNNLTLESGQLWSGSDWVNSWQCNYTYDTNNLTKSESYLQFDVTGTEITSGDSTWYYIDHAVGIAELITHNGYSEVHPNPNGGKFIITSMNDVIAIEIYNLSGQLVYSDFNINQRTSKEIDLSNLGKGMYIVKTHTGTKNHTEKVFVQ